MKEESRQMGGGRIYNMKVKGRTLKKIIFSSHKVGKEVITELEIGEFRMNES